MSLVGQSKFSNLDHTADASASVNDVTRRLRVGVNLPLTEFNYGEGASDGRIYLKSLRVEQERFDKVLIPRIGKIWKEYFSSGASRSPLSCQLDSEELKFCSTCYQICQ